MRIEEEEWQDEGRGGGKVTLFTEESDDLWVLFTLVEPDDEVTSGDEVEQRGEETPAEPIVCRAGSQGGPAEVRACPEGLSCCYPCGVEGCHWVCADAETCASWSTLP